MPVFRIGFIGTGNMGSALVESIADSGFLPVGNIAISDADHGKAQSLAAKTGVAYISENTEIASISDVLFLCVKPDMVRPVLQEIKPVLDFAHDKITVSIAAGIPLSVYSDELGDGRKVVRAMPNMPALVREGATALCANRYVTKEEMAEVKKLFSAAGIVEEFPEILIDKVTALTGSSPAYVFMLIEAMGDAAVKAGIQRKTAYRMAAQAVLGSAKMVMETGLHPAELKDRICSPAGTTIEAVRILEEKGFRSAVMEAMAGCAAKAEELGCNYSK